MKKRDREEVEEMIEEEIEHHKRWTFAHDPKTFLTLLVVIFVVSIITTWLFHIGFFSFRIEKGESQYQCLEWKNETTKECIEYSKHYVYDCYRGSDYYMTVTDKETADRWMKNYECSSITKRFDGYCIEYGYVESNKQVCTLEGKDCEESIICDSWTNKPLSHCESVHYKTVCSDYREVSE